MTRIFPILILLAALTGRPESAAASAPAGSGLAALSWLVGDWTGVGEGQPGTSASLRHAEPIQSGRFIRVDGRSVYPRQERNRTGEVHTSMDVWSYDRRRGLLVMRQFDSLGFVSTYVQDSNASRDGRLVMQSEHLENVPAGWRARYTYEHPSADEYREIFELDSGDGLEPYVTGRFLRSPGEPGRTPPS